jgi:hypothetical protein
MMIFDITFSLSPCYCILYVESACAHTDGKCSVLTKLMSSQSGVHQLQCSRDLAFSKIKSTLWGWTTPALLCLSFWSLAGNHARTKR